MNSARSPLALLFGLVILASLLTSVDAFGCETQGPQQTSLPAWLLAEAPVGVLQMDNGEFITLGRPGCLARLRAAAAEARPEPEDAGRFFRYNAAGRQLAELPSGIHWWVFYWPDYETAVRHWEALGAGSSEYRGLLIFEFADGRRAAVCNYDGAALPLDSELEDLVPRYVWYPGAELERLSKLAAQ